MTHALSDKNNTTKFKLIYSNVTEKDILLREEFNALKAKYPKTFDAVYLIDKPTEGWKGPVGYITADVIKKNVGSADLKEKVKIFVCGKFFYFWLWERDDNNCFLSQGPPPQVASIAGKKAGMKQGEIGGILKDLGYTEEQVCACSTSYGRPSLIQTFFFFFHRSSNSRKIAWERGYT